MNVASIASALGASAQANIDDAKARVSEAETAREADGPRRGPPGVGEAVVAEISPASYAKAGGVPAAAEAQETGDPPSRSLGSSPPGEAHKGTLVNAVG